MGWRELRARIGGATPSGAVVAETDVGSLALHEHDRVMTPFIRERGCWEPDEGAWLRGALDPGAVMVDVGANVGYFTLLASRAVGRRGTVIAVEPEPGNVRLLTHNVRANRCRNVQIVAAAAWESPATLSLRRNPVNAGDHQVHPEGEPAEEQVPAVALDDIVPARVDVIKIDTQGADHHVVAGLERTLRANPHARVLIEFWLDAMADRRLSALDVLDRYRALDRPLALLDAPERAVTDEQILAAARARPDHWANLIIGPAA